MTSYSEYGNERIHWANVHQIKSSHKTFCIQPLRSKLSPNNIQLKMSMSDPFDFRYKTYIFNMHLSQARYSLTSSLYVSVIQHKLTFYCVRRFIHCDMSSGSSELTAWCGYPLCWRPWRDLWMTHFGFVVRRDFVSWVPDIIIISSF